MKYPLIMSMTTFSTISSPPLIVKAAAWLPFAYLTTRVSTPNTSFNSTPLGLLKLFLTNFLLILVHVAKIVIRIMLLKVMATRHLMKKCSSFFILIIKMSHDHRHWNTTGLGNQCATSPSVPVSCIIDFFTSSCLCVLQTICFCQE